MKTKHERSSAYQEAFVGRSKVRLHCTTSFAILTRADRFSLNLHTSLQLSQVSMFPIAMFLLLTVPSRLTGDVKWPAWTPFGEALGPLAGAFPILSLRTNKADVIVGIEKDIADNHDKEGIDWRVSGK